MTPFLQLALAVAILLTAAKAGGYLSYRLGQPSVLGELIVGVLLGPSVINILHFPYFSSEHLSETIHLLAEIGVLLLMFLAGLDLHLKDLAKSGKVSALAGTLGVIFPLIMGAGLELLFKAEFSEAVFVGLTLAATSVSISAQTLMELKMLRSRVGVSLLGAAVFDDILVILGLSTFTALLSPTSSAGLTTVLMTVLRMSVYLGLALAVGMFLFPRLSRRIDRLPISQGLIAFTMVIILVYGWTAEELGSMAAITGSFVAGLALSRSPIKQRIENGIASIGYGLFVPIFFINVGLTVNARQITGNVFWLFLTMTLVAILAKVLGSGLGALWGGFSRREALQLGTGMMSRGEVGLIAASLGIAEGLIPQSTFSAVVGVVIVTTLLTPVLLRASFRHPKAQTPDQAVISKKTVGHPAPDDSSPPKGRSAIGNGG